MDQDAAWTRLFGQPVLAQHLFRLAMPGLVRWLDFSTLEEVTTRWAMAKVDDAPRLHTAGAYAARTGDRAWRVGYGDESGRSVLMPTEFQSDTDANMRVRSREYGLLGYQAAVRRQPDPDGSVRLVPVVIYSGGPSWAMSYPGWAQRRANVTATGEPWLEARASCVLLDADSCGGDDFDRQGNLVAALLRMNVLTRLEATVQVLTDMAQWLRRALPPERAAVAIHELVDWWAVCSKHAVTAEQVEHVRGALVQGGRDDMMALARTAREWPRIWREEGRAEGRQEGRAEGRQEGRAEGRQEGRAEGRQEGRRDGQVQLLQAQAAQKFGAPTAAALVERLERRGDAGAFVEVGRWIWECSSASELLARLDTLSPSVRD